MKLDITKNSNLSFKNAVITINDDNEIVVIEDTKDGVETNLLIDVLEQVFGDLRYDVTIKAKEEV